MLMKLVGNISTVENVYAYLCFARSGELPS